MYGIKCGLRHQIFRDTLLLYAPFSLSENDSDVAKRLQNLFPRDVAIAFALWKRTIKSGVKKSMTECKTRYIMFVYREGGEKTGVEKGKDKFDKYRKTCYSHF